MKLLSLTYRDTTFNWKLEKTNFNQLTLLVGASGVGKTQILRAINNLKKVAMGKSVNGIEWEVEFETIDKIQYIWIGEFENKGRYVFQHFESESTQKNKPDIIKEKLFMNGSEIVNRTVSELFFNKKKTLKLPQQQSVLYLLKEEEKIDQAFNAFKKIILSDQSTQAEAIGLSLFNSYLATKYDSIDKIKQSDEEIIKKLFYSSKINDVTFLQIKNRFIDIFPFVEDLKVEPLDLSAISVEYSFLRDSPFIQIKEFEVDEWINQTKMSSGMFKTLIQISELYLSPEGTVFLVDEFENSLGINCIDELTNDILESSRQLQFIITSHHPYIINNINFKNWKLVTRKAGVVKTQDATIYNIGKSKHDAFMQLMQLEEYQTGRME